MKLCSNEVDEVERFRYFGFILQKDGDFEYNV